MILFYHIRAALSKTNSSHIRKIVANTYLSISNEVNI